MVMVGVRMRRHCWRCFEGRQVRPPPLGKGLGLGLLGRQQGTAARWQGGRCAASRPGGVWEGSPAGREEYRERDGERMSGSWLMGGLGHVHIAG